MTVLSTAAAQSAPRNLRSIPRAIQPPVVLDAAGKTLPKLWLKDAIDDNVFGPFLVGDTTGSGFVIRDTSRGTDVIVGRGKANLLKARETAAAQLTYLQLSKAATRRMTVATNARIVDDGAQITAR